MTGVSKVKWCIVEEDFVLICMVLSTGTNEWNKTYFNSIKRKNLLKIRIFRNCNALLCKVVSYLTWQWIFLKVGTIMEFRTLSEIQNRKWKLYCIFKSLKKWSDFNSRTTVNEEKGGCTGWENDPGGSSILIGLLILYFPVTCKVVNMQWSRCWTNASWGKLWWL